MAWSSRASSWARTKPTGANSLRAGRARARPPVGPVSVMLVAAVIGRRRHQRRRDDAGLQQGRRCACQLQHASGVRGRDLTSRVGRHHRHPSEDTCRPARSAGRSNRDLGTTEATREAHANSGELTWPFSLGALTAPAARRSRLRPATDRPPTRQLGQGTRGLQGPWVLARDAREFEILNCDVLGSIRGSNRTVQQTG